MKDAAMKDFDDGGTILVLTLGFMALSLALIVVVVDVSSVFLARKSLVEACDGAALAGAQALDDNRLYLDGADADIPLGSDDVADAVADYEANLDQPGDQQLSAETDGQTVTVHGSRTVELPFAHYLKELGWGSVTVTAISEAQGQQR